MSSPVALTILSLLGFIFGVLAGRREFDGEILVLLGAIFAMLLPIIGSAQHFWWGWPWWPIVVPAHAVTAFAGVLWFGRESYGST